MEIFALFVWPGALLGGLIAYGLFVSRRPKTAEERAREEATALDESRKVRQQVDELTDRIEAIQAKLAAEDAAIKAAVRLRRVQTGQFMVRQRAHKEKALVARYVHGT